MAGSALRSSGAHMRDPLATAAILPKYNPLEQGPSCHLDEASSLRAVRPSGLHMLDKHGMWGLESSLGRFSFVAGVVVAV